LIKAYRVGVIMISFLATLHPRRSHANQTHLTWVSAHSLPSGLWPSAQESHLICLSLQKRRRSRAYISAYRRWGISPRPENIYIFITLYADWQGHERGVIPVWLNTT